MMKYLLLSALSAAMLMTGCTKDVYDNDEQRPAGGATIAVGFTSPGIAEAVAWTPAEEVAWAPTKMQSALPALADASAIDAPATGIDEGLVLQLTAGREYVPTASDSLPPMAAPATRTALPANTTVRVVAYTTASGNPLKANYVAEQTYYMKDGNLEPCTVNVDGSFSAADADAGLLLESANYDFYAITPALPLNADKATLSVPNGVDYASSITQNVEATETVALTQMDRKCVRVELSVAQPAGVNFFETLTVKSAQLSALSAARTVTIGGDIPAGTGSEVLAPVFTNPSVAVATATVYLLPVSGLNLNATYNLYVKQVGETAKDLTVKSSLPNLTLEKGKSYTLTGIVRDGIFIGDLTLSPMGIIAAAGATVTVKSPYAPTGSVWTASMMNTLTGVSLGAVSGSGSGCSVPVTFAINPNNSERSTTLMATADWAETPRTIMLTQAGATMGNLSQSPGNNITAEGATVTVTTPGATPGLSWAATLSNTTGFTLGTVSGSGNTGSVPVTVAFNPTNATRSTVLTVKAKDGNTSGAVTITQAAASLSYFSASATTPVAYTATSVTFTVTGTAGLTLRLAKTSGDAAFSTPNPTTLTCNGSAQTVTVTMGSSTSPSQREAAYSATVTNSGASGLNLTGITVKQLPNPRAVSYITVAGDPTGLPAGMYCVGMYGGHNGSNYTKALYMDKRGTNTTGVNPANTSDGKFYGEGNTYDSSDYDGLHHSRHPYCDGKGMFLPAINQLRAMYNAKSQAPGVYDFIAEMYWSSSGFISLQNPQLKCLDFKNGSEGGAQKNQYNMLYVRCVREW